MSRCRVHVHSTCMCLKMMQVMRLYSIYSSLMHGCTFSSDMSIQIYAIINIKVITCPCYEDPLTPHFYILKPGFTGVHIFFLIFALKHRLWLLVRTALVRRVTSTRNICLEQKRENYHFFNLKFVIFTVVKNRCILHGYVFVM